MGVLGVFFNFPEGTDTGIAFGFREVDQLAIGGGPDRWAWGDDGVAWLPAQSAPPMQGNPSNFKGSVWAAKSI